MTVTRKRWPARSAFLATGIGAGLGLDAVMVFPGEAMIHGGGAFLIAWVIALATAAVPLISLEYALGIYYQTSVPDAMRRIDKRLEWVGWWSATLAGVVALTLVAVLAHGVIVAGDALLALVGGVHVPVRDASSAPDSSSPGGLLVCALAALWLGTHAVVGAGVSRFGHLAMAAIACAVIGTAAAGGALLTVPGAIDGLAAMTTPEWSALVDPETWISAYALAFRALGLGLGVYVALASHLNRGADATGTAAATVLAGACFSLPAALVVAAAQGALAAAAGTPFIGPAAATVADATTVPIALAQVDVQPWLRSLICLSWAIGWIGAGATALVAMVATVADAVSDKFQIERAEALSRLCVVGFFVSVPLAAAWGADWRIAIHHIAFAFGAVPALCVQCLGLAWTAGGVGLQRHINAYSVIPVHRGWQLLIGALAPIALLCVAVAGLRPIAMPSLLVVGCVALAIAFSASLAQLPARRPG